MLKETIRQQKMDRRLAMSVETMGELSKSIQERLLKSSFWPKTGRVGLYAPVKNEVSTHQLFRMALESGLHAYFPRVELGIAFYEVNGPEDLQRGSWSIPEPKIDCAELLPEEFFDLLVLPGIVFTKDCHRVGYGRGFYDQYIANLKRPVPVVGLAYDFQVVEHVDVDSWDQALNAVITEKNIYMK